MTLPGHDHSGGGIWLAFLFGLLLLNVPLAERLAERMAAVPCLIGLVGFLLGNLYLTLKIARARSIKAGLVCTVCDATFSRSGMDGGRNRSRQLRQLWAQVPGGLRSINQRRA